MSEKAPDSAASLRHWEMALSRWENEGGAGPAGAQRGAVTTEAQPKTDHLTNDELSSSDRVHGDSDLCPRAV
jgi:hypothetical protein